MKITDTEKFAITCISVLSKKSEAEIKEVFLALLALFTVEISVGKGHVTVPFLGDFKVDYDNVGGETLEQTFVKLSPTLKATIEAIAKNAEEPPLLKHYKGDIASFLVTQLDIKNQPHQYDLFKQ